MTSGFQRDIYLFLSLYRFVAYGLAVILTQVDLLRNFAEPAGATYALMGGVGLYTLLKVVGPLRGWRQGPMGYPVLAADVAVCLTTLLITGGLESEYLLYSLTPVVISALLFPERVTLAAAATVSLGVAVAHVTPAWWDTDYTWIMEGNRLLWLILYIISTFIIATIAYRTNFNIRGRIEAVAVDEERRRMRRELHDGLAQSLAYLSSKTEQAGKLLTQGLPSEASKAVDEIRSVAQQTYQDVRDSLEQLGAEAGPLIPALAEYTAAFGQQNNIAVDFEKPATSLRLSPLEEFQLLRITQEALSNIRRHAQASQVWITLVGGRDTVTLTIRDNGQGFSLEDAIRDGAGHHGLNVMQERAQGLGGALHIRSAPSQGTEVVTELPRRRHGV